MSIALNVLRPRLNPIQPFSLFYSSSFGPRTNQASQLDLTRDRLGAYLTRVLRRLRFFYKLDFLLSRFRFVFRSDSFVQLHFVLYSTRINTNAPVLLRRRLRWSQISNAQRRFILALRARRVSQTLSGVFPQQRAYIRRILKVLRKWFFFPPRRCPRNLSRKDFLKMARNPIRFRRVLFILPFLSLRRQRRSASNFRFLSAFPIPLALMGSTSRRRRFSLSAYTIPGVVRDPLLVEFLLPFRFQRLLHRRSGLLSETGSFSFFDPVWPMVSFFSRFPVNRTRLKTRLTDPNAFLLLFGVFYSRLFRRQPLVFKLLACRGHYSVLKGLRRFNVRFASMFPFLRQVEFSYHYEYGMESLNSRLLLEYIYVRLRLRYRLSQIVSRRFLYRLNAYFYGVYFLAKGRFERRQRAMYRRYFIGVFSPNTELYNLDVFFRPIVTKHGRGGLRLALNSPRPVSHLVSVVN